MRSRPLLAATNAMSMFAVMAVGTLAMYGQTNTAIVTGTVTDATQAVIPHASLEIRSDQTGVIKSVLANENGQFTFNFLPVGTYNLTVQAKGFQTLDRKDLMLVADLVLRLDLQLNIGDVNQTLTVSGEAPLVSLATSDQLRTISNREVRQLPQQKLDWTSLTNLNTGIAIVSAASSPGSTGTIAMNGLSPEGMGITVDGTNASSDPEEPAFGFYQQPNVINAVNTDAIGEVSVVKGIMPASVGGTLSGNVNIITKNGTNEFHGDVYEVNDTNDYDARNQFQPKRLRSTFNQFGGALGGPILKNRLFFFGSYEGVRSTAYQPLTANVPSPYLISQSPSVYSNIFSVFPKVPQPASPTALTGVYTGSASGVQNDSNTVERFDYYFSPTNQLTFRYTRSAPDKFAPTAVAVNSRLTQATDDMYNANYTHSGVNWTSSTRFGYNRLHMFRVDEGFYVGLAGVSFSGFSTGGSEYYVLDGGTYTWMEDFAYNRGKHSIEIGGVVQRLDSGRIDLNTANFSYASLADFQANIPNSVSITFDVPSSVLHIYQFGGYVQDAYKVTSHLTLNLGLRYDYFTVPKERDGRLFNRGFDPTRPQLGAGFGPYLPASSIYHADYANLQPRVGFAYTPGSDRKTVIRGGGGVFVGPRPMYAGPLTEMQAGPNIPFRATFSRPTDLAAGLSYPIANADFVPTLTSLQARGILSSQIAANTTIDQNYPNPYSLQWTMAVERELGFGTTLSVGYVGTRGLKMNETMRENLPDRLTGITPDPTFAVFVLNSAVDASTYHSLQVSLNKRFSRGLLFGVNFTHANNMTFGKGDSVGGGDPQDKNNIRADWGPSPFAIRNVFNSSVAYELPFQKWIGRSGTASRLLLGGWQLSGILSANDGMPFTVTNGNSIYPSSRPDVVPGVNAIYGNYASTLQYINPAAYFNIPIVSASGAQARPGNLGRDAQWTPGMWNLDAAVAKALAITERWRLRLRCDLFNSLNHTNLTGLSTNISAGNFGRLTSATARDIQIGARLEF